MKNSEFYTFVLILYFPICYVFGCALLIVDTHAKEKIAECYEKIQDLEKWQIGMSITYAKDRLEYQNHTHRYSDGRIK